MRLIDADALKAKLKIDTNTATYSDYCNGYCDARQVDLDAIDAAQTIEPEVRHGRWIECDYKTLEHGEIESAYKAGLCCSECRTGFKKNRMTHKAFCPACGAKMKQEQPIAYNQAHTGAITSEQFEAIWNDKDEGAADNG